ncbi:MAG: protein-L-isoaspartate(D-aspartate) O-methyltransferase [Anaerolineae bacterium]
MLLYAARLLVIATLSLSACGQAATPLATSIPPSATGDDTYVEQREQMVADQIEARGVSDTAVLDAMRRVPRHQFVPAEYLDQVYDDHPLPIGFGQTISQPYIVALMSEKLELEPGAKVLEIGAGSGYQAAVLAEMGMQVYTVEIIPELAEPAATRLQSLGYTDVQVRAADGYWGWPEEAPFDAIIVTAAPDHVPQPLVEQLKPGGRMVIPVGPVGAFQTLWQFVADESGELIAHNLGAVSFVPLTRGE